MNTLSSLFSDPLLIEEINSKSRRKTLSKDDVLIFPGEVLVFVPIVLTGALRIVREDEEGREVFLYHLYPFETCAMAAPFGHQRGTRPATLRRDGGSDAHSSPAGDSSVAGCEPASVALGSVWKRKSTR